MSKLENGLKLPSGKSLLHTAPHHDDVMLSYHPMMRGLMTDNTNHVMYGTSGFTSVSNDYLQSILGTVMSSQVEDFYEFITQEDATPVLELFKSGYETDTLQKMDLAEPLFGLRSFYQVFKADQDLSTQGKLFQAVDAFRA